jgi:hypothetical protein
VTGWNDARLNSSARTNSSYSCQKVSLKDFQSHFVGKFKSHFSSGCNSPRVFNSFSAYPSSVVALIADRLCSMEKNGHSGSQRQTKFLIGRGLESIWFMLRASGK